MADEGLPFCISPEAHAQLLTLLDLIKQGHDKAHIPDLDRGVASLYWCIETLVNDFVLGPMIVLGMTRYVADAGDFNFSLGPYRIWIDEHTLALLHGRTLIWEQRTVPAPIHAHHCFWVDPVPDDSFVVSRHLAIEHRAPEHQRICKEL